MVIYRQFRNTDPPRLEEVWNETFTKRGAVFLQGSTPLERYVLAKPYFDPAGLVLAEEDGVCLGFAHAGLAIGSDPARGVVSLVGVRPSQRKRGIGSELLSRSETYLRDHGAQVLLAGGKGSENPFYLGLYGGSDSPGFLRSDADALPFFTKKGFRVDRQFLVMQRDLSKPVKLADSRFAAFRQKYEIHAHTPRDLGSFANECCLGSLEPMEFVLREKKTSAAVAHTLVWEMEGFSWRWGRPAVGLVGFTVVPEIRRQGLGKFFLGYLLRQLQEQYFEIMETQIEDSDQPALSFLQNLGFQQVDMGQIFIK